MIDKKRKMELEQFSSQVLFKNDMYKIPVNLLKIAKNCQIKVYYADFEQLGNKNVSGAIRYVNDRFSILLNKEEPEARRRFSLAHELGHFFFDQEILKSSKIHVDTLYRSLLNSTEDSKTIDKETRQKLTDDREIDYFASALLMNEMVLRKVFSVETSVLKLAEIFNVPHSAMVVRLDMLGLI